MKKYKYIWTPALLLLILFMGPVNLAAQGEVAQWLRYDVNIAIQENSGINVEEIQDVALVQGATTLQKIIPADKLELIENVQVLELNPGGGQRGYQQTDTQADYTFQVIPSEDEYTIQLYFPPNTVPSTKFVIRYFVVGALRFYDEGDQLDWRPFGDSAGAAITNSTTNVLLPGDVPADQISQSSTGLTTENFIPEAGKVVFLTSNIGSGDDLEISVKFPHGIVQGSPPEWQRVAELTFRLQWGSVIAALVILFFGLALVCGWWYLKLRVAPDSSKKIPKYIKKPPSRLTPAVSGALLDGKAGPRHIMATLLDLAAKGSLNVYSPQEDQNADTEDDKPAAETELVFDLYNVDQEKATQPYETTLYGKVFGYMGSRVRRLSDIRRTLYMSVPELKNQIDLEIAKAGFFAEDKQMVRRRYTAFGAAGVIMAIVLASLALLAFANLTVLVVCPFLSIIIGSIAFIVAGYAKSTKTQKGATHAAQWEAFRRYLKEMTPKRAAKARPVFPRLLPYAVAFGVEKEFVKNFAAANTATPKWWSIPEEKLPDVDHEDAHAWVSADIMAQPKAQPRPEKQGRTTPIIRRLGTPDEDDATSEAALKDIQPKFMAFLNAGTEVFAKAPALDADEEIDFESLGPE